MANITRDIYRKACNYAYGIFQKGKALLDPDVNDTREILFNQIRDMTDTMNLTGYKDTAFQLTQASSGNQENNFMVTSGIGYSEGLRLYLDTTANLVPASSPSIAETTLWSIVSSVGTSTFTDGRMNWTTDALKDRTAVFFDIDGATLEYNIASNTSNSIVTSLPLDSGVIAEKYYTIKPKTPTATRSDAVLLNIFLDEVSPVEDPTLYNNLGGNYESERRVRIRQVVEIIQDVTEVGYTVPANYTDSLGNLHHYSLLGFITRDSAGADITGGMITDSRSNLHNIGDYVLKTGDTMTGNLNMEGASILLDTGDVRLLSGNVNVGAGDVNVDAGDITLGVGKITGSADGYINPQNISTVSTESNAVAGFDLIAGQKLQILDDSGDEVGNLIVDGLTNDITLVSPTQEPLTLSVAMPLYSTHTANKQYVDREIQSHTHPVYVTRSELGRWVTESFAGYIGIVSNEWADGNEVEVPHNLGDSFVITTLQTYNSTPTILGWTQVDSGRFNIRIIDANTIGLTNNTGSAIAEEDARCCVLKAHSTQTITVTEYIDGITDFGGLT